MGRRKRLILQADLTSEEDQAFLAWVREKIRKRRLANEIREGLRLQYVRGTGQVPLAYPSYPGQVETLGQQRQAGVQHERQAASSTSNQLLRLVQSF